MTGSVSIPVILGDVVLLLLPLETKLKARLIASFSLLVVSMSLYYFIKIYLA